MLNKLWILMWYNQRVIIVVNKELKSLQHNLNNNKLLVNRLLWLLNKIIKVETLFPKQNRLMVNYFEKIKIFKIRFNKKNQLI